MSRLERRLCCAVLVEGWLIDRAGGVRWRSECASCGRAALGARRREDRDPLALSISFEGDQ
jgi:hypothetical protein